LTIALEPSSRGTVAENMQPPVASAAQALPDATRKASLFAILLRLAQHFGRRISRDQLGAAAASADGRLSLDEFRRAAGLFGYEVCFERATRKALAEAPIPFALVSTDRDSAVLVTGRNGRSVTIFDPQAEATRTVTTSEVLRLGDRVLIFDRAPEFSWLQLVRRSVRYALWELVAASLFLNLFALAPPIFMMTVYNKIIAHKALGTLDILLVGMLLVYGLEALLRGLRSYIASHTGTKLDALLGKEVVHRILETPYSRLKARSSGHYHETLRQLDTIQQFFTSQAPLLLVDVLFIFVFLTMLTVLSPMLGALTLLAMPIPILFSALFYKAQKRLNAEKLAATSARSTTLAEVAGCATTIKGMALEAYVERKLADRLAQGAVTGLKAASAVNVINVVAAGFQQVLHLLIIFFGARMVISGEISFGALIAASLLAGRALAPLRQCVAAIQQFHDVRTAIGQLNAVVSEERSDFFAGLGVPQRIAALHVEGLTFRYAPDARPALAGISLSLPAGSITGISGRSGCGKSTLAKLLQGLLAPSEGRILVDDTDLAHLSGVAWRRFIGIVPQEIEIFSGTIRENIALAGPDAPFENVIAAAKFACAHEFIQRLPRGYETVLSSGGPELSAGQRQQLCIARMVVRDPTILIFDEATSALDRESETQLMQNLKRCIGGRIVVVISHRPVPLMFADQVATLSDGRLVRVEQHSNPAERAVAG
jgi:ABC-type bacteriocin/lantibiotic exporter with double-glycine peptidase domain